MRYTEITGLAGNTIIVGKTWFKKNLADAIKFSSACKCGGNVYGYDGWKTQENEDVYLCIVCGSLQGKPLVAKATGAVKKKKTAVKTAKAVPKAVKPVEKPATTKIDPEGIKIDEIKGIGKATAEQLTMAGIHTAADMLALSSKVIASKIGRKSDTQIKKWLANIDEMLKP